jgi:S1-C subfamily serine protease
MIGKNSLFELAKALEGVLVVGCLRGTPAALAGVGYGDILLSVNGRRTRNFADYLEAKALRKDGMSVVVFRAGVEHPIELEYRPNRDDADPAALLAELVGMRVLSGDLPDDREGGARS